MKKTFDTIDLAKFLASILIFSMHCKALGDFRNGNYLLQIVARWGVPFFFICSSYFLFSKDRDGQISKDSIRSYARRIGMLYAVWFVINLPNVYHKRLYPYDLTQISTWLTFVKDAVLSKTFTGSWYLLSSVFSAYFVYLLSKKLKTIHILFISMPLYLLCALSSLYFGLLPAKLAQVLSFLCFPLNLLNGCFYFALGKLIVENRSRVLTIFTKRRAFIAFVFFYAVFVAEFYFAKRYHVLQSTDVAFSTAAIALFLFLFLIQTRIEIRHARLLRKLSTIVFCCQGNVLLINELFKKKLGMSSLFAYFLSLILVALICAAVLYIQKQNRWKWAKYLT